MRKHKHLAARDTRALCDAFLSFFGGVLADWRSYYADRTFDAERFAESRPNGFGPLVRGMCTSQMFTQFAAAQFEATDDVWRNAAGETIYLFILPKKLCSYFIQYFLKKQNVLN